MENNIVLYRKYRPVARLAALASLGLALRFRLAPSKPSVLNNFLHGEIPNFPDPLFAAGTFLLLIF